jgi:hypothetical protein
MDLPACQRSTLGAWGHGWHRAILGVKPRIGGVSCGTGFGSACLFVVADGHMFYEEYLGRADPEPARQPPPVRTEGGFHITGDKDKQSCSGQPIVTTSYNLLSPLIRSSNS